MLDLGPDTGFELLDFVDECIDGAVCLVQFPAISWAHVRLPAHTRPGVKPPVGSLIPRIGMDNAFPPAQQTIAFGHIAQMAGRAAYRMDQSGVGIHADVLRLHPKVPLVALLARMHLGVALALLVLCLTWRGNERSVHGAAFFEQQALAAQHIIDSGQDAIGQLVFLQPVTKPQNGALVR